MSKSILSVLAISAGFACTTSAASAQQLLGVGNFGNAVQTQTLYSINTATGAATPIGNTGLAQISGLAWDGSTLWAMTVSADLYTINTGTGAATLVATQANTLPEGDILAYNGELFNITSAGMYSSVNAVTGALTPVVDISAAGSDFSGLLTNGAFNVALAFNGADADTLVVFGSTGLVATLPTGTNASGVGALASNGVTGWMSDGSNLYTLDSSTGAASLVGAFGVNGMSGLAFVPAPGAAALMGLGLMRAARRRR